MDPCPWGRQLLSKHWEQTIMTGFSVFPFVWFIDISVNVKPEGHRLSQQTTMLLGIVSLLPAQRQRCWVLCHCFLPNDNAAGYCVTASCPTTTLLGIVSLLPAQRQRCWVLCHCFLPNDNAAGYCHCFLSNDNAAGYCVTASCPNRQDVQCSRP